MVNIVGRRSSCLQAWGGSFAAEPLVVLPSPSPREPAMYLSWAQRSRNMALKATVRITVLARAMR